MVSQREHDLLRFLLSIEDRLDRVRDVESALVVALRMTREFFGADESCLATLLPGRARVRLRQRVPKESCWDEAMLAAFLHRERPRLPSDLVLAYVERRGRPWAAICLRRAADPFDADSAGEMRRIGERVSRVVDRADRLRIADARMRIGRKIMEQIRPKDLFYQILHSLRSLTLYDHSAALLIHHEEARTLELVAEQIAWRKGKSEKIGLVLTLEDEARRWFEGGEVLGFDRAGKAWRAWEKDRSAAPAELLDFNAGDAGEGAERAMLCAPLTTRHGLLGVLKIASRHPQSLREYEADLVQSFLPFAVVAIRNLRRTESLESGMLAAEKKHFMADLARGVSHDINNALGSVLPLVQQMATDARRGEIDAGTLGRDLEHIEASLQVCRRIFGGMLAFARGSAKGIGQGDVRRAIDSTLAILEERTKRLAIRVRVELAESLPHVRGPQGDLEQVLLNLATNACDAMPKGGDLSVSAGRSDGEVAIEISDSGVGIPSENLSRIQEPFFSTRRDGNGLGLAICRSIVWENGGRLSFDSDPRRGTRVTVRLPVAGAETAEEE